MKEIITASSERVGIDLGKGTLSEGVLSLLILTRTEKLLGEPLPGTGFEAAEITAGRMKRRRIRRRAERTGSWARFLRTGEMTYLLLSPSVKIAGEKTVPLKKERLPDLLDRAEEIRKKG